MKEPKKPNSEEKENEKSEDYERFENAVRKVLSIPPEEAKRIRERFSPNKRKRKTPNK